MLNENTVSKLQEMRLSVMARAFRDQMKDSGFNGMSFEERFGLMVDAEWATRKSNSMTRLIKNADYAISTACIEDIEYHPDRNLDKMQITRLAACNYIQECHNIIILGATGSGKTFISCSLGMAASRNFYNVKYVRLPDLLNELAVARGDGSYRKVIKQYKQIRLLILDEWLLFPLKDSETCLKLLRQDIKEPPQSSVLNSMPVAGILRSVSRHWLTLSATESYTIPIQ